MRHLTSITHVPAQAWTEEEAYNWGYCMVATLMWPKKGGPDVPAECDGILGLQ